MSQVLTPPETLTPPVPVQAVLQTQAEGIVKLDQPTFERLDAKVADFVDTVIHADVQSDDFKQKVGAIHGLGAESLLKGQSARIQQQAASATVNLEQLKKAFSNVYEAMDIVADYKALDNMRQTVDALTSEVTKARTYLDRVRRDETAAATQDVAVTNASGVIQL